MECPVIDWRSSHAYPLQVIANNLRRKNSDAVYTLYFLSSNREYISEKNKQTTNTN